MQRDEFAQLVGEILDELPPAFAVHLDNVEVLVDDYPTPKHRRSLGIEPWETVYGCYEGVPLTEREADDIGPPAVIIIFQQPLEHDFRDPSTLREQLRRTILHEVAHHFGISDERLEDLGAY